MLLVADDLFRVGLSRLLMDEGIDVTTELPADAALVDATGPSRGVEAVERTIALCGPGEEEAIEALSRGASAVVWRGSEPAVIASALRTAVAGGVVMPAGAAARLLEREREARAAALPDRRVIEALSVRELEVLRLVAGGLANDEIADELVVTTSTVKNHVARIMAKIGARNRTQAAVLATRLLD